MSIEELIALRQRGSSRVHLAEVSRLRAQNVEFASPKVKSNIDIQAFTQGEIRKFDTINTEDKSSRDNELPVYTNGDRSETSTKSIINAESGDVKEHYPITQTSNGDETGILQKIRLEIPHRMVEVVDLLTTLSSLPSAKVTEKSKNTKSDGNEMSEGIEMAISNNGSHVFTTGEARMVRPNDSINPTQAGFVEEIAKEEPKGINLLTIFCDTRNASENIKNQEERETLLKVRPSIITSGAILGVAIIVFLTIFIICKVKQKQKYRYRNTFSRAVFQGPVMTARKLSSSSSLSNVMVNVVATSTTKRPERNEMHENTVDTDPKSDIDSDSLDANDSWETIPDYMKY